MPLATRGGLVFLTRAAIGVTISVAAAAPPRATASESIHQGLITVTAASNGRLNIQAGSNRYIVTSGFSYPGTRIGWNTFAATRGSDQPGWVPLVRRPTPKALAITAQGSTYRIQRRITVAGDKIRIIDRFTNISSAPAGVFIHDRLTAANSFVESIIPGGAENPTVYLRGRKQVLGLVVTDDLGRLLMQASVTGARLHLRFGEGLPTLALAPGESYHLHWTIYVLPARTSYFDFMNRLRRAWHCNFPIEGFWKGFNVAPQSSNRQIPLLNHPKKLRAWIGRYGLQTGIVVLGPWIGYDPYCQCSYDWTQKEYLHRARRAVRVFHEVDPKIKVIGMIETDLIKIVPKQIPGGQVFTELNAPQFKNGKELSEALTRLVEKDHLPYLNSIKFSPSGHPLITEISCGSPHLYFWAYPAPGNWVENRMLGEIHFALNKVGLDGVYIDDFNQTANVPGDTSFPACSFRGWDRHTADVDPATGKIRHLTVDCSYVGAPSRLKIIHAVLDQGKFILTNGWATTRTEQRLPAMHFKETFWYYKPDTYPDGTEPPLLNMLLGGNLSTPINYAVQPNAGVQGTCTARDCMKAVIAGLRNGTPLFYLRDVNNAPSVATFERNVLRRMYPLTPVALHTGWIQGQQRIITCVSGSYRLASVRRPRVFLFSLNGHRVQPDFKIQHAGDTWCITLQMKNWAQLAIIR